MIFFSREVKSLTMRCAKNNLIIVKLCFLSDIQKTFSFIENNTVKCDVCFAKMKNFYILH